MKKYILIALVLSLTILTLGACGSKTLHCDGCGTEVRVRSNSNMEEDWIILCGDCEEEAFGENPLVTEE